MKRLPAFLSILLVALVSVAWVVKETKSNEDMKFYVSPSGTPTLAINVTGTTGAVTIPAMSTGVVHSGSGGALTSSTIVNADVNASAAIDGSKIVNATNSVAGVVSTGTQTFAGDKTFNGSITPAGGIIGTTSGSAATDTHVGYYAEILYNSASPPGATGQCGSGGTVAMPAGDFICGAQHGNTAGGITALTACVMDAGCNGTAFSAGCIVGLTRTNSANSGETSGAVAGTHFNKSGAWTLNLQLLATYSATSIAAKAWCYRIR